MSSAQIQTEAPFVQDSPRKRRQGNDDLGDASLKHKKPKLARMDSPVKEGESCIDKLSTEDRQGDDLKEANAESKVTELVEKTDLAEDNDSSSEQDESLDFLLTGGDLLVDFSASSKESKLVGFHPAVEGVTVTRPQHQKPFKYGDYTILLGLDDYPVPEYRSFAVTFCDKDENPLSGPNTPLRLYERGDPNCVLPILGFSTWTVPSSRRWVVKDVSDGDREVMKFGGMAVLEETILC